MVSIELSLTCMSSKSESMLGMAYNTFTLTYLDYCRQAELTMPQVQPSILATNLWPVPTDVFAF